jgi:hypothetical protein
MKESVALAKDADAKKDFSSTRSDKSIRRVRNEPEKQLGSLRSVIGNIRHDGGTPSLDSIATELSSMHTAQRASVLLALQRTHGNRYVQRVVTGIQAKLKVGQPGDIYEQEADRVADAVMQMPEPRVQRQAEEKEEEKELIQIKPLAEQITPLVQRRAVEEEEETPQAKIISPDIPMIHRQEEPQEEETLQPKLEINAEHTIQRREEDEEEEEILQAKGQSGQTTEVTSDLESRIQALKGGGQPLPKSVRAFFAPRFGQDFSHIRIHSNTEGAHLARKLNAKAFTTGSNIVFGSGEYSPGSSRGKQLLAHELTHVMQQSKERSLKKEPNVDKGLRVHRANSMEIRLKDIKVGDPELPEKKDLDFTIATVLGEASPTGPIREKHGIAMVLKRRVEEKWKGKSTFKNIILNTGVYGNPTRNALSRLAELYLNKKANNLNEFQQLVDKVKGLRKSDRDYLKTKGGFKTFVERIEQAKMATEFVLAEAKYEPILETISKEATWWGGEIDLWDAKTGEFRRHGTRVAKNELVFVVYQEVGKTYFLKTAASIKGEAARNKQIERSKKLLCDELERNTKWTKEQIKKNNPDVCK